MPHHNSLSYLPKPVMVAKLLMHLLHNKMMS